jgi:outer membrane protein assembly factor BamA
MEYFELYGRVEHTTDGLNRGRFVPPGVESYNDLAGTGLRWYRNYLTPYWDPEGGYKLDLNFEHGLPIVGTYSWYDRVQGEFVFVKSMPEGLSYLSETKLALRAYGGMGWPDKGYHYQLGGSSRVRGLPRSEREGDQLWVGTVEWRLPIWKRTELEFLYQAAKLEHLYAVVFYDVGEIYLNGQTNGGVIHSIGAGLRFDVGWLGFIERTTFRLDVAKAIRQNESPQVWIGLQHAF